MNVPKFPTAEARAAYSRRLRDQHPFWWVWFKITRQL